MERKRWFKAEREIESQRWREEYVQRDMGIERWKKEARLMEKG